MFAANDGQESNQNAALSALKQANVEASQINQVEAFAAGSSSQLAAESKALSAVYSNANIVSSKQKVGHLYNASGMASLIASVLAVKNANHVAINGLGMDNSVAHLILSNRDAHKAMPSQRDNSN